MTSSTPVKYLRDGEWRLGLVRSLLADYPGYYAVFLVRDALSCKEFVINSKNLEWL